MLHLLCVVVKLTAFVFAQYWQHLTFTQKDGFEHAASLILKFCDHERWKRLADSTRVQVVFVASELAKLKAKKAEAVVSLLLRQIPSGTVAQEHLWLASALIGLLQQNRLANWCIVFVCELTAADAFRFVVAG